MQDVLVHNVVATSALLLYLSWTRYICRNTCSTPQLTQSRPTYTTDRCNIWLSSQSDWNRLIQSNIMPDRVKIYLFYNSNVTLRLQLIFLWRICPCKHNLVRTVLWLT